MLVVEMCLVRLCSPKMKLCSSKVWLMTSPFLNTSVPGCLILLSHYHVAMCLIYDFGDLFLFSLIDQYKLKHALNGLSLKVTHLRCWPGQLSHNEHSDGGNYDTGSLSHVA